MTELIVFAAMVSTLCGTVFWLARNTDRHNQERRDAPRKHQQARQAEPAAS